MIHLTTIAMVLSWVIAAAAVLLTILADSEGRRRDYKWMRYHLRMASLLVICNCVATTAILAQTRQVGPTVQRTSAVQSGGGVATLAR